MCSCVILLVCMCVLARACEFIKFEILLNKSTNILSTFIIKEQLPKNP